MFGVLYYFREATLDVVEVAPEVEAEAPSQTDRENEDNSRSMGAHNNQPEASIPDNFSKVYKIATNGLPKGKKSFREKKREVCSDS